ncbi:MAG: histidinol-phosphate transaminase [Chloroflexota bacterium]
MTVEFAKVPGVRPSVERMAEYAGPGDAVALAGRLGVPVEQIVKLDANENPYGCSPLVAEVLGQFSRYHQYPESEHVETRQRISDYVGVGPEHIMVGNGSDEIIDLVMRAFLDPGDEVMDFPPTFGIYSFNAQHQDARVIAIERDDQFRVRLDAAIAALTPRTKLIFLATPNNPTGTPTSRADIERLLDTGRIVVVDEAYAEFAAMDPEGFDSLVADVPNHPNLLVFRTFSKWAGLAGLRVGYGVLPTWIAEHIWKLKPPFNVNSAALAAVAAALETREAQMKTVRAVIDQRNRLMAELPSLGYLTPTPTRTNFILCALNGITGRELRDALMDRGVMTRAYGGARLERSLRLSVGRPADNDRLLGALREIGRERGLS